MRTLLVLADARVATDTTLPADATAEAWRKALITAREVKELMKESAWDDLDEEPPMR